MINNNLKPAEFFSCNLFVAASYCVVLKQYSIDYLKATVVIEFLLHLKFISKMGLVGYIVQISDISLMEQKIEEYYAD